MDDQGELATRLEAALAASGARLDGGLSGKELASIEARYRFVFAPDHRLLLTLALPLGDDRRWPDWRHGSEEDLRGRVAWPVDGLLFDVEHNSLRLPGWPDRPSPMADALAVAAEQLRSVPPLAPLYSHWYVPTVPAEAGNPGAVLLSGRRHLLRPEPARLVRLGVQPTLLGWSRAVQTRALLVRHRRSGLLTGLTGHPTRARGSRPARSAERAPLRAGWLRSGVWRRPSSV